jgi:hypothetical protein
MAIISLMHEIITTTIITIIIKKEGALRLITQLS